MSADKKPVRLLILGTGNMARSHADAFRRIEDVDLVAAVDQRADVLSAFAREFSIPQTFETLDAALDWNAFDAATNVTPDAAHHPTTMKLLEAGKHVLCEKPLATNASHAWDMANTARARNLIGMVNLSYRDVPALQKAAELVRGGAIGALRHFEASYLQSWLTQPAWGDWRTESQWLWRLSTAHGSNGVLGDVGIHILDFTVFAAGSGVKDLSCRLKTFDKSDGGRIGDYKLDANDSFTLQAELENSAIGTISATRFASGHLNDLRLRLYGDEGGLEVLFENRTSGLRICRGPNLTSAHWEDVETPEVPTVYQRFAAAIRGEGPEAPGFEDGASLQAALDLAERSHEQNGAFLRLASPTSG
ncbi:Gfo/Idh/MocA family oxidoreductase [Roseibium denhamense]|uniref:Predicted dehydrogenase n=1 Tax=Roseibium denhamense TaxID=76305 RepID=A0ABY1P8S3_9HYPH|nr:Gfo/Idh/MocA family oxidoreductase [Roseibium denhamense]MTI07332.1 Gfo/Idh/MocA family oxidoreductase [Roseibium denhamense]SMP28906.1 Predicted dehydrogenase [Roseibium denhamense]